MLRKLLSSRRRVAARPIGLIPAGQRLYAIGDIHGRLDLLETLLDLIETDNAARLSTKTQLLFLGDLIDRGPQSAQVVERLMQFARDRPSTRFLLGNHEEVFLTALSGDVKALKFFHRIGGRETILSYGITPEEYKKLDYHELLNWLITHVPPAHCAFLNRFEDLIIVGDYAFVHAGVRPEAPLAHQKAKDLRWIRDEFLNFEGAHEKVIVHGHTISDEVQELPSRIGIDTGAYASGKLTAMGFEGRDRWVLQTAPDAKLAP